MRMPDQFDYPSDITIPNHDCESLRPHVLAAADFASGDWPRPTRPSRLGVGPFVAMGVVLGMAAALPVTAWAVRAHHWPNVEPMHATAAPMAPLCPLAAAGPASPPIPSPSPAPAAPASTPGLDTFAGVVSMSSETSVSEKVRKKHKGFGKHAAAHPDRAKLAAALDATSERSAMPAAQAAASGRAQPATDVGGQTEEQAASARPSGVRANHPHARRAPNKPIGPVEDEAVAELSASLK